MKGVLFFTLLIAAILLAIHWRAETHPLLIDAAADSFCDMPFRQQAPLVAPPGGKYDYRIGRPAREGRNA